MGVSLYFGLPGAGKTTMMVYVALKARKSKVYRHIYCNVPIAVDGVTYIDNDCIGKYDLSDCLILVDEGTLFANNRDYKNFSKEKTQYMLLHRHYNADLIFFSQEWASLDKRIRAVTDRVYYVYKGKFLGKWFTRCYRIPYGIIIPDPKKDGGEKLGEIIQGYAKPPFLTRLFSPWLYRPRYYKYFDSWDRPPLPPLPSRYKEFEDLEQRIPARKAKLKTKMQAVIEKLRLKRVQGSQEEESSHSALETEIAGTPDERSSGRRRADSASE